MSGSGFVDMTHRLSLWLWARGVSDADKVSVEIRFPTDRAASEAKAALMRDMEPWMAADGIVALDEPFMMNGIRVTLSGPANLDRRP